MGPPYMANPEKCKLLSPTGNYAGARAVSGRFQAQHGHMPLGKILGSVYLAHFSGLAVILVPQGATESPAIVKKRKIGLGDLNRGGLGAMRPCTRP